MPVMTFSHKSLTTFQAPFMLIAFSAHCCGLSGSFGLADATSRLAGLSGSQILRSAQRTVMVRWNQLRVCLQRPATLRPIRCCRLGCHSRGWRVQQQHRLTRVFRQQLPAECSEAGLRLFLRAAKVAGERRDAARVVERAEVHGGDLEVRRRRDGLHLHAGRRVCRGVALCGLLSFECRAEHLRTPAEHQQVCRA